MSLDYALFARRATSLDGLAASDYDVFVSSFNLSDRVQQVFDAARASVKHWLIHPEYALAESDKPQGPHVFEGTAGDEADFWAEYFAWANGVEPTARLAVDVTGMMRPHLVLLMKLLALRGHRHVTVLYSDPLFYSSGAKTAFAKGAVSEVRQVRGFEGQHIAGRGDGELLVIGAGYDHELIRRVADTKASARKYQMFGLPSLQHHMYQESHLRASLASESLSSPVNEYLLFAPAQDPFVTAQVLQDAVRREERSGMLGNLYLSPLGTKAQALGFALYYLMERDDGGPSSLIFPYAPAYSSETSKGLSRISICEVELDWFQCFEQTSSVQSD